MPWLFLPLVTGLLTRCSDDASRGDTLVPSATSTGTTVTDVTTGGAGGGDEVPTTGSIGTTGSTTEAGTTTTTDAPDPACGDGVIDREEECDDGEFANDDNAFCTGMCKLNVCGDGHVFVGWELCDQGLANSDAYGSPCGANCEPGARCGDHIIQAGHEQCDLGADNGGIGGDEQGILCDASCGMKALRAFVTMQEFTGDLGGIEGADKKCSDAASAAGLTEPQRFHAYLSTPDDPANSRFPGLATVAWPYVLVTGKKIADSHAALLAGGPLSEGISVTEAGASLYDAVIATNTTPGGNNYAPDQHCMSWTSADQLLAARVGLTFPAAVDEVPAWQSGSWWVSALTRQCNKPELHLYCLEIQP